MRQYLTALGFAALPAAGKFLGGLAAEFARSPAGRSASPYMPPPGS